MTCSNAITGHVFAVRPHAEPWHPLVYLCRDCSIKRVNNEWKTTLEPPLLVTCGCCGARQYPKQMVEMDGLIVCTYCVEKETNLVWIVENAKKKPAVQLY